MEEKKDAIQAEPAETGGTLTVDFSRSYQWEGVEYDSLDLSAIEDVSGTDLIAAARYAQRKGVTTVMPETSLEYAFFMASRATQLPVEFFNTLKGKDALRIKNAIISFFYGED